MKSREISIYSCEWCGKEFTSFQECLDHEAACLEARIKDQPQSPLYEKGDLVKCNNSTQYGYFIVDHIYVDQETNEFCYRRDSQILGCPESELRLIAKREEVEARLATIQKQLGDLGGHRLDLHLINDGYITFSGQIAGGWNEHKN